jgi:hypothetical protein
MEYEETYSSHGGLERGRDACELLKPSRLKQVQIRLNILV